MSVETAERTTLHLDPSSTTRKTHPVMEVTPGAGGTYVWIGDDERCFATFGPSKRKLRALRDALNVALDER